MKKALLALICFCFCVAANAQMENPVTWSYTAKKIKGDLYELHMTAVLGPKWHIYSQDISGDGPVPTSFTFDKNPLVKTEGPVSEVGKLQKEFDKNFNLTLKFYGSKVDFVQKVKLKSCCEYCSQRKNYLHGLQRSKMPSSKRCAFCHKINAKF